MSLMRDYVEALFGTLPQTADVLEMKRNILEHIEDQHAALLAEGHNEYEALGRMISELGSLDEIRQGLDLPPGIPPQDPPGGGYARREGGGNSPIPKLRLLQAIGISLICLSPFFGGYEAEGVFPVVALGIGLLLFARGRVRDLLWLAGYTAYTDAQLSLLPQYEKFLFRMRIAYSGAIALFILSPVCVNATGEAMLFFGMIAAGVCLLIYFRGRQSDYSALLAKPDKEPSIGKDAFL